MPTQIEIGVLEELKKMLDINSTKPVIKNRFSVSIIYGLTFIIPIIMNSTFLFVSVAAVLLVLAFRELMALEDVNIFKKKSLTITVLFLILIMLSVTTTPGESVWLGFAISGFILIYPLLAVLTAKSFKVILMTLFGMISIGLGLISAVSIFSIQPMLVLFVFAGIWSADTFAYLVGKNFGKRKFTKISPNKTIEGVIGSFVGTIIFMFFVVYVIFPIIYSFASNVQPLDISIGAQIFLSIAIVVASLTGDLLFSSVKRYYNVKDFSNMLGSHGGILDRIDSLIIAMPLVLAILTFLPLS